MYPLGVSITKLQVQSAGKKKGKEYFKYTINIPKEDIEELKWAKGDVLTIIVDGKTLKIKKAR